MLLVGKSTHIGKRTEESEIEIRNKSVTHQYIWRHGLREFALTELDCHEVFCTQHHHAEPRVVAHAFAARVRHVVVHLAPGWAGGEDP